MNALSSASRPPEIRHIMGMPIAIDQRDPACIDVEPVFDWLRTVDATFSTYRADSDISRLDRGEITLAGCRSEVDDVLTRCLDLEGFTHGFFSVRPAGRLDPSGLLKGWAIDRAAERLAAAGAENFCINAGGDVIARGRPSPDSRWRVASGILSTSRPSRPRSPWKIWPSRRPGNTSAVRTSSIRTPAIGPPASSL